MMIGTVVGGLFTFGTAKTGEHPLLSLAASNVKTRCTTFMFTVITAAVKGLGG